MKPYKIKVCPSVEWGTWTLNLDNAYWYNTPCREIAVIDRYWPRVDWKLLIFFVLYQACDQIKNKR